MALTALLAAGAVPAAAASQGTPEQAQSVPDDGTSDAPPAFGPRTALRDIRDYVTSPLRWDGTDWLLFGGAVALVAAAHPFDSRLRDHFTAGSRSALDGKDTSSTKDALPALAVVGVTGAFAVLGNDSGGLSETWAMLEAGGLASGTGFVLKYVAGRERPNATTDPNAWRQGGASFPSLHASASMAIGTVLAESGNDEYRWLRRILGYGMAAGTDYLRLKHNAHWLSDVVAGDALGAATGLFVVDRENGTTHAAGLNVGPGGGGGILVSYTVPLH